MQDSTLFGKVYGSIIGGAIGDAFCLRTEFMHYKDIHRQYGWVTHFDPLPPRKPSTESPLQRFYSFGRPWKGEGRFHPMGRWSKEVGVYTDDTRFKLLLCHAILENRGPVDGPALSRYFLNYRLTAEGAERHGPTLRWDGPEREYARIIASADRLGRMANSHRSIFSTYDGPIGLLHAGNPEDAARDGYIMAAAVATAMLPNATMDLVIENVLRYCSCLDSIDPRFTGEFEGRLNRLIEIARTVEDIGSLYEPLYREFLVTYPPWHMNGLLEMVPFALTICSAAQGEPEKAIIGTANLGRDADTIGSFVGEILGALSGWEAFPREWVDKVARLNPEPDMAKLAEDLSSLIKRRAEEAGRRSAELLSMA